MAHCTMTEEADSNRGVTQVNQMTTKSDLFTI